MQKKYSFFGAGISRIHPIVIITVIAFLFSFLTDGLIQLASIIIFLVMLAFFAMWTRNEIKK